MIDIGLISNYNDLMKTRDAISIISKIKHKINNVIISELSKQGIEGIVVSHGDILYALFQKEKMTMAEIASRIGKDKSTVTALVNKLVHYGYVSKERDTEDARVVYVAITAAGKRLEPSFEEISKKVLDLFYKNFSEEEKEDLFRLLNKIDKNL